MIVRVMMRLLASVIACFLLSGCDDGGSHRTNGRDSAKAAGELAGIRSRIGAVEARNDVLVRRIDQVEKRLAAVVGLHLALEQVVAENSRRGRLARQAIRRQLEPLTRDVVKDRARLDLLEAGFDRLGSKIRRLQENASKRQYWDRDGLCDRCQKLKRETVTCAPALTRSHLRERITQLGKAVLDVDERLRRSQAVIDAKLLLLASELRRLRKLSRSLRYRN